MTRAELQHWRATARLSQAGLAALLGLHPFTVSKWERGERGIPSFLWLALWALDHGAIAEDHSAKTLSRSR